MYSQTMMDMNPNPQPTPDDIDPALVAAMEARVVSRKVQDYGNRKAGPGRPKGSTKPVGSGKKAGTPSLMTPEFRQWLADRARPFELLADICTGASIQDGDTMRKPTVAERMRAAETLTRKLLPDLAATAITGASGGPVLMSGHIHSQVEIARRLAFVLSSAVNEVTDTQSPPPVQGAPGFHAPMPATLPVNPEPSEVGDYTVGFAESLPGDRERWAIRDGAGRLVGTAFGREAAEAKANQKQGSNR